MTSTVRLGLAILSIAQAAPLSTLDQATHLPTLEEAALEDAAILEDHKLSTSRKCPANTTLSTSKESPYLPTSERVSLIIANTSSSELITLDKEATVEQTAAELETIPPKVTLVPVNEKAVAKDGASVSIDTFLTDTLLGALAEEADNKRRVQRYRLASNTDVKDNVILFLDLNF